MLAFAFAATTASGATFIGLPALAYNAEADQKSWTEMQAFFKKIFPKR